MLREKLVKALARSMDFIKHESDNLPIGMRGELEVIVKDRDGNIVSYERGHNQVTNFAKMQIIHLLAGEYGVEDRSIYSCDKTGAEGKKHFVFEQDKPENAAKVKQGFALADHTTTSNNDGCMISGKQFFDTFTEDNDSKELSQVSMSSLTPPGQILQANQPVKMLFGTGLEASTTSDINAAYQTEGVEKSFINKINGFNADPNYNTNFFKALTEDSLKFTNYYSGPKSAYVSGDVGANRARTLQPASTAALSTATAKTDNAITGAIKNCYIMSANDNAKYDPTTKMAYGYYRGVGYPAYIYARKKSGTIGGEGFYNQDSKTYINYSVNSSTTENSDYETEVTYVVDMPAQPANVENVQSFYPYNGWILRQAGLFSDARYFIRSKKDGDDEVTEMTNDYPNYVNSASGMLLFKRNLSSPILKTPDLQITFAWHVYITV